MPAIETQLETLSMPKAYWVATYPVMKNPERHVIAARLAAAAVEAGGGTFIVRGNPVRTYEFGHDQRVVIVEFSSVEQAMAAYDSPAYQAAVAILGDDANRDIRIIEAL